MAEIAIVENLQRKDLNPLEKAASFHDYLQRYDCTQDDLAARLKIDRSTIANLIRLLELPTLVQDAVRQGAISQGHARALLPLGDESRQLDFCRRIQAESWSVRTTEEQVQELIHQEDTPTVGLASAVGKPPRKARSSQVAALEQGLRTALGTKVEVRHTASGKGKIVVHFASAAEFERLREQLCDRPARSKTG
jgi:ParB family chromosome partitioning protein